MRGNGLVFLCPFAEKLSFSEGVSLSEYKLEGR